MALNPNIILAGQTPDILGALDGGRQAAQNQLAMDRQTAMQDLYRSQGANILAGEQNALNQLAQFDPMAALGVQDARLGMDARRQEMAFSAERMQMARMKAAASRQRRRASCRRSNWPQSSRRSAVGCKGPRSSTRTRTRRVTSGSCSRTALIPHNSCSRNSRPRRHVRGRAGGHAAVRAANGDPGERYKVVGGTLFDLQAEGGPAVVGQGAMQETVIMGPDGKPIMVQGGPGAAVKFTDAQSKDNVYATRAEGAYAALEPVADALASYGGAAAEAVLFNLGRPFQSEDYQLARQAGLEFLAVILRKDTGAAVTAAEEDMYGRMFLPQPGDTPAVLEQKRVARGRAVEAIKSGMNPDQIAAMGRALLATEARTGADQPTPDDMQAPSADGWIDMGNGVRIRKVE